MSAQQITNAFTVDVEEYFHASALAEVAPPSEWGRLPSSVEQNTERLLELLDDAGYRGTFFTLGWIAEKFPGLVARIAAAGHEVACHGYSHTLVYNQDEATFREETRRAKQELEDRSGQPVTGYRAATFSISAATPWAHDVLAELGFAYDSSVFPVRHDRYGDPKAPRFPYRISGRGGSLTEFPMSTIRFAGMNLPVAGGGYFRLLPLAVSLAGLRRINVRENRAFVFYTHPWEIDSSQPRFDLGWLSGIRHYRNTDVCEQRLRKLFEEFRFDTCAAVLEEAGFDVSSAGPGLLASATTA